MSNIIPDGWELATIGSLGKVITGSTPSTQEPKFWGRDVPFISPSDFDGSVYVKETQRKLTKLGADKGRLLPKDSVLVTCIGSLGGIAMAASESTTNQQINSLVPSRDNDPRFCFYNILFNIDELTKNAGTTTIPIINKSTFELINLLRPPLPEQQKIASILTVVDEVIESTTAQINKLKDLKTGMMQELLTKGIGHTEFKDSPVGRIPRAWEVALFEDIFEFKNGVNKGKEFFGKGVPIISFKNVFRGGGINDSDITGFVEMDDLELDRFRVQRGDVFFTRTSETPSEIGLANVYLGIQENVVFSGFVIRGRPKGNYLDPKYSKFAFESSNVRLQMILNSKFTTRAGISGESLARIEIALPSTKEQIKIASVLESMQVKKDVIERRLFSLMAMKKALMQDLLTGKVRVKIN